MVESRSYGGKGMAAEDARELESIKRLLILLLLKFGATSQEIGAALGTDSSVVRKMMPIKTVKKIETVR